MNSCKQFIGTLGQALLYLRIALRVAAHYLIRPRQFHYNPIRYIAFLKNAALLLLIFRHNRPIRTPTGWKLHLYLPEFPSAAFFRAIEAKLIHSPPGPVTVVFSMTKACRYKCEHCYQRKDAGSDLDEPALLQLARDVHDAGTSMFDIEGGEPLLQPVRLIHLCETVRQGTEIWINTTGDQLSNHMILRLKRAGLYGVMVSIHSPQHHLHDAFTGVPGSFKTAYSAIQACRKAGLVVAINAVLSEEELRAGELDVLMELSRSLQCHFVQLIHPKASGLWLGRTEQMQTDPALIDQIRNDHIRYNRHDHASYPALAAQAFEEAPHVLGCTAGAIDRFYINAHGEVQPCEFLNVSFGNIQSEPFKLILKRMRKAFPIPGTDWLCCTRAAEIAEAIEAAGGTTPLPWSETEKLVQHWPQPPPTPIYKKLGIYDTSTPPPTDTTDA
jgi:MoaA/NifB/PqqE/SkfB family radical SAM enzyme